MGSPGVNFYRGGVNMLPGERLGNEAFGLFLVLRTSSSSQMGDQALCEKGRDVQTCSQMHCSKVSKMYTNKANGANITCASYQCMQNPDLNTCCDKVQSNIVVL